MTLKGKPWPPFVQVAPSIALLIYLLFAIHWCARWKATAIDTAEILQQCSDVAHDCCGVEEP